MNQVINPSADAERVAHTISIVELSGSVPYNAMGTRRGRVRVDSRGTGD